MKIALDHVFSALSLALDLAENVPYGHGRRVAFLSLKVSEKIGLDREKMSQIYYAGLLHDIGMSNAVAEQHFRSDLAMLHAEKGSEIVKGLPTGDKISGIIRYHHENWDGSGGFKRSGNQIPLESRIIYAVDQFDIRFDRFKDYYGQISHLMEWLEHNSGKMFDPEVVSVLLRLMEADKFWLDMIHFDEVYTRPDVVFNNVVYLDTQDLINIAEVFAGIIDTKSRFTYNHSKTLARIAMDICKKCDIDQLTSSKIYIAALLHDLGKLGVPNEILEKADNLSDYEFYVIKSHPYFTKVILNQIDGFEDIAQWAGNHHEKLDYSGYPERLGGDQLTFYDRLLAICDMYTALTENRPYRKGLSHRQAMEILKQSAKRGKIDSEVLDLFADIG
ncbi:HD-GYP domain-containing protein [Caldanaerobius polysaccharolyticus]|uniref:HD-GYP domain-containing protein n=1 Tax=Caldanaerobius polysaccharolyticus TaxID=44256 RepID=UPI0004787055|nr:HD domain-containing phosphohydrolase [Caldanaerobius polysaccharolyticus]